MTAEQQLKALKYAIVYLSDEIQNIDENLKHCEKSDFLRNVLTNRKNELKVDLDELTGLEIYQEESQ